MWLTVWLDVFAKGSKMSVILDTQRQQIILIFHFGVRIQGLYTGLSFWYVNSCLIEWQRPSLSLTTAATIPMGTRSSPHRRQGCEDARTK